MHRRSQMAAINDARSKIAVMCIVFICFAHLPLSSYRMCMFAREKKKKDTEAAEKRKREEAEKILENQHGGKEGLAAFRDEARKQEMRKNGTLAFSFPPSLVQTSSSSKLFDQSSERDLEMIKCLFFPLEINKSQFFSFSPYSHPEHGAPPVRPFATWSRKPQHARGHQVVSFACKHHLSKFSLKAH